MALKSEVKEKWVAALRSGDYAQTQSHLRDSKGFCCLGVLCDLHLKDAPTDNGRWKKDKDNLAGVESYYGCVALLPLRVHGWAIEGNTSLDPLSWMNDQGKSFAEIADYIERNY